MVVRSRFLAAAWRAMSIFRRRAGQLFASGRPVLVLVVLCMVFAWVFASVDYLLSLPFVVCGVGAVLVFLYTLQRIEQDG
jgi:hypothetical protein